MTGSHLMDVYRLDDMVKGWFVGDFEPTALRTAACEVSVKHYKWRRKRSGSRSQGRDRINDDRIGPG
jgi:hypothetical protein